VTTPWYARGDVLPGRAIVPFVLGMPRDEVEGILREDVSVRAQGELDVLETATLWFWFSRRTGQLRQVMAWGAWEGRLFGRFRLGAPLGEIEAFGGHLSADRDGNVTVDLHPGLCFSFDGTLPEAPTALRALPIETICVYPPHL
jgi:hypothetical protein